MKTATICDWNGAKRLFRQLLTGCVLLLPVAGHAGQSAPTIKLFPTTVLEEIKDHYDLEVTRATRAVNASPGSSARAISKCWTSWRTGCRRWRPR